MKMEKSSQQMIEFFAKVLPTNEDITQRKVFGYPAGFINGNMFTSLYGNDMILRLSEKDRMQFVSEYKASIFEPMPGRPMKEYVVIPRSLLSNSDTLVHWQNKSVEYVRSLPEKVKKEKK